MSEPRSETEVIEKYKQMRQELGALSEKMNELESKVRAPSAVFAYRLGRCRYVRCAMPCSPSSHIGHDDAQDNLKLASCCLCMAAKFCRITQLPKHFRCCPTTGAGAHAGAADAGAAGGGSQVLPARGRRAGGAECGHHPAHRAEQPGQPQTRESRAIVLWSICAASAGGLWRIHVCRC